MTLSIDTPLTGTVIDTQITAWGPAGESLFENSVPSISDGLRLLQDKHWTEIQLISVLPSGGLIVKDCHSGNTAMIIEIIR